MTDIIEKLWNGGIVPSVTCVSNNENLQELADLIRRNKNDLIYELNENQKETLDKLLDCFDEYTYFISFCAFREGFSLATKLMCETLSSQQ